MGSPCCLSRTPHRLKTSRPPPPPCATTDQVDVRRGEWARFWLGRLFALRVRVGRRDLLVRPSTGWSLAQLVTRHWLGLSDTEPSFPDEASRSNQLSIFSCRVRVPRTSGLGQGLVGPSAGLSHPLTTPAAASARRPYWVHTSHSTQHSPLFRRVQQGRATADGRKTRHGLGFSLMILPAGYSRPFIPSPPSYPVCSRPSPPAFHSALTHAPGNPATAWLPDGRLITRARPLPLFPRPARAPRKNAHPLPLPPA